MVRQPTFEEFDHTVSELINTIKYMRFGNVFKDLLEGLLDILKRLLNREYSFEMDGGSANVWGIFVVIVSVIGLLLLVLIIRTLRRRKKKKVIVDILGEEINETSSVLNFREKGEICRLNGQYRDATRLQFIAILFHLHQNNILYHDQTMTGKEMIKVLKEQDFSAIDSFTILVKMFNSTWYGCDSVDIESYNDWSKIEKDFWQEVQR